MFQKKQRQMQIAKYQLLCQQTKVNSISQNYKKKIPYYNGQLIASNMRILNQRYSFFLPVQSISFYILFYHNFVRVCQIFDNSTNNSLGLFLCYDVS